MNFCVYHPPAGSNLTNELRLPPIIFDPNCQSILMRTDQSLETPACKDSLANICFFFSCCKFIIFYNKFNILDKQNDRNTFVKLQFQTLIKFSFEKTFENIKYNFQRLVFYLHIFSNYCREASILHKKTQELNHKDLINLQYCQK